MPLLCALNKINKKHLLIYSIKLISFRNEKSLRGTSGKTVEVPINYRERLGEKKLKIGYWTTILNRILQEGIH